MRVYLDNCCFNRPFDDQAGIRVKLETDAKLYIQLMIRAKKIELAWSYILDFENEANPFFERKYTIEKWKHLSVIDIDETEAVLLMANNFTKQGLKAKDALHVACAIETKCDFFLTTDDIIQKKMKNVNGIKVFNPIEFINVIEEL
jgi:predicted nucleic acid-binding protein